MGIGSLRSTEAAFLLKSSHRQLSCTLTMLSTFSIKQHTQLSKRVCSIYLCKYFFVEGIFIVTRKQQKFPPALQKTRTASCYHFEILGSQRSDWSSSDINMWRRWPLTWVEKCLVSNQGDLLALSFSASLFHWPLRKAVWNEPVVTGQVGEKPYL